MRLAASTTSTGSGSAASTAPASIAMPGGNCRKAVPRVVMALCCRRDQWAVEVANDRFHNLRLLGAIDRRTKFGRARKAFRVPTEMLASDAAPNGSAIMRQHV